MFEMLEEHIMPTEDTIMPYFTILACCPPTDSQRSTKNYKSIFVYFSKLLSTERILCCLGAPDLLS